MHVHHRPMRWGIGARSKRLLCASSALFFIAGCSGLIDGGGNDAGSAADGGHPIDTHDGGLCTDTWEDFGQPFFTTNCTGCHAHDHANFVTQSVVQNELDLIIDKVASGAMPKEATLSAEDQHRILIFLACGAPSGVFDAGVPFEAASVRTAVAKVKNILVGLPVTDAEVSAVETDQAALKGLITGWMALPEYRQKMMTFFELAFQQTQISPIDFVDLIPNQGLTTGVGVPLVVQNLRESFARTMLALIDEGRPFTDAFTTHRLMMTPAMMEVYGFLDARPVNNAGKPANLLPRYSTDVITIRKAGGAVPLEQSTDPTSANFMKWYNADVGALEYRSDQQYCQIDPIVVPLNPYSIHYVLFGSVPPYQHPSGFCPSKVTPGAMVFKASDFTTWKMVTLRQPNAGEAVSVFFDLPALRAANELVLKTPRTGFFSTPAFAANWQTNASNQMRVTINQTLIVATGRSVDGIDGTPSPSTPGLDAVHAEKTECFACHRLLDPTRSILASNWSWFYYPQADPATRAQKGRFIFQGVDAAVSSLDDFGSTLANHPLMASAWAQKLCYYVNSAPCSEHDPEFKRVVDAFKTSSFSWPVLVRELMSSPLMTNLGPTLTHSTIGESIAVTRRDHLCAALNNRLKLNDVCGLTLVLGKSVGAGAIPQIATGVPSDGYGRGGTAPVLPNQPTLFYRSALENICLQVADMTIDAAVDPAQPLATHWSSTTDAQSTAAIADFMSSIVGMPAGDPRATEVKALLQAHFTEATRTQSRTSALKSTFVTACLSPTFIGIGL